MRFYKRKAKVVPEYIAVTPSEKQYIMDNIFGEELKINGHKKDIKIFESEEGFTYLEYKSKRYLADIIEKNQNKYVVLINGISYSFTIESPISYKRRKFLASSKQVSRMESVTAPMPGKIIELLVEENAKIKEGEAILILEAMKMQNEITSQVSGRIKKVCVKAGDNVSKEQVLVEIIR